MFFLNTGVEFLWAYWWLSGKEPTCNAAGVGSIPGSGRSPGEGNANSLQYSCLGNPKDRGAWRAIVHRVTNKLNSAAERQQQTAVIPLQCRVSFCCITWVSSMYMHVPSLLNLPPTSYPHSTLLGIMEPQAELPGLCSNTPSMLLSQIIPPSSSHRVHTPVLYICVSIPALKIGSSVLFF